MVAEGICRALAVQIFARIGGVRVGEKPLSNWTVSRRR
jgi:hypothetical protein